MTTYTTCRPHVRPEAPNLYGASVSGSTVGLSVVADGPGVYRPRHPERTSFYQILDDHFESYVRVHEERFEPRSGPLRPVVRETVEAFLNCAQLKNGFARLRCEACGGEHLLAFSCQRRGICSSCVAKRSALFAEKLTEEILAPVPHHHVVFTIPKALRGLFERERSLLGRLAGWAYEAVKTCFQEVLAHHDAVPGFVASIQTFGAYGCNFHPHLHALVTAGLLATGGEFIPLPSVDTSVPTFAFRKLVLDGLHKAERLSDRFRESLLSWTHSGFSIWLGPAIPADDGDQLERMARYLTRPPIAMGSVMLTPEGQVLISTPPDPRTGESIKILDPLEWIQAITSQIPDPRQHVALYYGAYANRARAKYRQSKDETPTAPLPIDHPDDAETAFAKSRRKSWARLLRKIFEVDPMICARCGVEMKVISVVTSPKTIDRILAHVKSGKGHDPFEARAPPSSLGQTG